MQKGQKNEYEGLGKLKIDLALEKLIVKKKENNVKRKKRFRKTPFRKTTESYPNFCAPFIISVNS